MKYTNFFISILSKMPESTTLQNRTKTVLQWEGLLSYQMSSVFQKIDFQELLHFPGVKLHSMRFLEFPGVVASQDKGKDCGV